MDFDFNLILVPLTLFFLVIWLWDVFILKQSHRFKTYQYKIAQHQHEVDQQQVAFDRLSAQYPHLNLTAASAHADEPIVVTSARDQLNAHKMQLLRLEQEYATQKRSPIIVWAHDFLPVLLLVLVVRSFLFEPFNIPSESMNPTLMTGDFVLVNKYAFGVRLPLLNTKFIDSGRPQHGDIAVFRYPKNPKISFIKRVIGLPGDKIVFNSGELWVNGIKQPYHVEKTVALPIGYQDANGVSQSLSVQAQQWRVHLGQHRFLSQYVLPDQPKGAAAELVKTMSERIPLSLQQQWQVDVPAGHYFVMGDNRDQSDDSRFWGFVPDENLAGKAVYLWMHKAPGWHLPQFSRNDVLP